MEPPSLNEYIAIALCKMVKGLEYHHPEAWANQVWEFPYIVMTGNGEMGKHLSVVDGTYLIFCRSRNLIIFLGHEHVLDIVSAAYRYCQERVGCSKCPGRPYSRNKR